MSGWSVDVPADGTSATLYKLGEEPAVSMATMAVWESATKGAFDTLVRRFMTLEDVRAEEEVKEILFGETGKQYAAAILSPWFRDLKDNARTDYIIAKFVGPNDPSGQLLNIFAGELESGVTDLVKEYHRWLKDRIDRIGPNTRSQFTDELYDLLDPTNLQNDAENVYYNLQLITEENYDFWNPTSVQKGILTSTTVGTQISYTLTNPKQFSGVKNNLGDAFFYFIVAFCTFRRLYIGNQLKLAYDYLLKTLIPLSVKWLQLSEKKEKTQYFLIDSIGNRLNEVVEFENVSPISDTMFDQTFPNLLNGTSNLTIGTDNYDIKLAHTWENLARGFFYAEYNQTTPTNNRQNFDTTDTYDIECKESALEYLRSNPYREEFFEGHDTLWNAVNNVFRNRWELVSGAVSCDGSPESFVKENSDRIWKEFKKMKEAGKKSFGVGRNLLDIPSFSGVAPFVSHWFESARLQAYIQKQREDSRSSKRRRTERADFGEEYEEETYSSNWPSERMHFSKMQREIEVKRIVNLIALLMIAPSKDEFWYKNTESTRPDNQFMFKTCAKRWFGNYTQKKKVNYGGNRKGVALCEHVVLQGVNIDCASLSLNDAFENLASVININETSGHVKFANNTEKLFGDRFEDDKTKLTPTSTSSIPMARQEEKEIEEFTLLPASNERPTHEVFISDKFWVVGASPTLITCAGKIALNIIQSIQMAVANAQLQDPN